MALTTAQLATLALIPGYAEVIETKAHRNGNTNWCDIARGVRYARTGLYTGITFIIIGVADAALNGKSTDTAYMGVGLTLISSIKLSEATHTLMTKWPEFEIRYGPFFNPVQ